MSNATNLTFADFKRPTFDTTFADNMLDFFELASNNFSLVSETTAEVNINQIMFSSFQKQISEIDGVKLIQYLAMKSREYFKVVHKQYVSAKVVEFISKKAYDQTIDNIAYRIALTTFHAEVREKAKFYLDNKDEKVTFEDKQLEADMNTMGIIVYELGLGSGVYFDDVLRDIRLEVEARVTKIVQWQVEQLNK